MWVILFNDCGFPTIVCLFIFCWSKWLIYCITIQNLSLNGISLSGLNISFMVRIQIKICQDTPTQTCICSHQLQWKALKIFILQPRMQYRCQKLDKNGLKVVKYKVLGIFFLVWLIKSHYTDASTERVWHWKNWMTTIEWHVHVQYVPACHATCQIIFFFLKVCLVTYRPSGQISRCSDVACLVFWGSRTSQLQQVQGENQCWFIYFSIYN